MFIDKIFLYQIQKYLKFIIFALIFIVSSCSSIYVPTSINTPLFKKAGEAQLSGYIGTHQLQARIAYTPAYHFGIMFNTAFNNHSYLGWVYNNKSSFYEFGIGYYTMLNRNFVFETYGGFSKGKMQYEDYYQEIVKNDIQKIFVTPSIGFVSDNLDFGFSLRYLNYTCFKMKGTLYSDFIEPCVTMKIGLDNIKLISEFGASMPIGNNKEIANLPVFINFGAQLSFFEKKKLQVPKN